MPTPSTEHATRTSRLLEGCLTIGCVLLAGWVAVTGTRAGVTSGWVALWCAGVVSLAGSARYPQIGLYAYVALVYGMQRYHDDYTKMFEIGAPNGLCLLAALGWANWMKRSGRRFVVSDHLSRLMGLLVVWLLITAGAALMRGQPWQPYPKHHPQLYLHGLVLFLIASHVLTGATQAWALSLVIGLTVCVRGLISGGGGIYREGDISALAVIALPLAVLGLRVGPDWVVKGVFGVLGVGLAAMTAWAQNRAAAVGFIAVLVVGWIGLKHKWRVLARAAPVLILVAVVFASSGYGKRFSGIWQGTDDRNSVTERLRIWEAGWEMFRQHPVLGVGVGNYHNRVDDHNTDLPRQRAAHNNYVQMIAEAGFPGLVLYVSLFAGTLVVLWQVGSIAGPDWPGPAARMLAASIVAYLVVGLFISRQDMALAYLFVGWAVALRDQWLGRHGIDLSNPLPTVPPPVRHPAAPRDQAHRGGAREGVGGVHEPAAHRPLKQLRRQDQPHT